MKQITFTLATFFCLTTLSMFKQQTPIDSAVQFSKICVNVEVLCYDFTQNEQVVNWNEEYSNESDSADLAEFMSKFPQLKLPYSITLLSHLKNVKPISNLRWTKKIKKDMIKGLYAIGLIKDCGSTKSLLLVSHPPNSTIYVFYVYEMQDGYIIREGSDDGGVGYLSGYNDTFYNQGHVRVDRLGTTYIVTKEISGGTFKKYETKIKACE